MESCQSENSSNVKIPELFPYQLEGILTSLKFLHSPRHACFNKSATGTGKSAMCLGAIKALLNKNHIQSVLIVAPAVVCHNFIREINLWLPNISAEHVKKYETITKPYSNTHQIKVISYDMFSRAFKVLPKPDLIVFDECHYLKSLKTKRTRASRHFAQNVKYKIFMTATPFINSTTDAYAAFAMCDPNLFPSPIFYADEYSNKQFTKWGVKYRGGKNLEKLSTITKNSFLFGYSKDVLTNLPEMYRSTLFLESSQIICSKEEATRALQDFNNGIKSQSISRIRHDTGLAKINPATAFVEDLLDQEKPVILFAHHKDVISKLSHKLSKYKPVTITGETDSISRMIAIDKFQNGETNLIIMNIVAGGVGINLQRAEHVVFAEFDWTYAANHQAESRAHRNGQLNNVTVTYLLLENSLDEIIFRTIMSKKNLHDKF